MGSTVGRLILFNFFYHTITIEYLSENRLFCIGFFFVNYVSFSSASDCDVSGCVKEKRKTRILFVREKKKQDIVEYNCTFSRTYMSL